MNKLYDPLRRKEVAATPEEMVRQWFIKELRETFGVPVHMMMSEAALKFGDKLYRADILVYGKRGDSLGPVAVVECKRPEVELSAAVLEQAMRYNSVLGVNVLIVTNGMKTFVYELHDGVFTPCTVVPQYKDMVK